MSFLYNCFDYNSSYYCWINFQVKKLLISSSLLNLIETFPGLLTVDPESRLKIEDVLKSSWVNGRSAPSTPLLSPGYIPGSPRSQSTFHMTVKALNRVARKGFQLSEVNNAPLAKRRKRKRKTSGSTETRTSSNESGLSHSSGGGTSESASSTLVSAKDVEPNDSSNIPSSSSSCSASSLEENQRSLPSPSLTTVTSATTSVISYR